MQTRASHLAVIRLMAVGLTASLLLTACSSSSSQSPTASGGGVGSSQPTASGGVVGSSSPAASAGVVELTYWGELAPFQAQVDQFNSSHPGIHVTYVNKPDETTIETDLSVAIEAGTNIPDMVNEETQYVPSRLALGQLLNLADYGANDVKDKFLPGDWALVSSGTGIYGYPNGPSPFVLFCNQDVLNQFGIAVPTTWDALAAAAAQLHSKDKTRYLTTWEAYPSHFFGLLENGGATPFQVNGHDITINFSSPEAMRVADYWTSLVRSGNLSSAASFSNDWNTALGNGTIACWLSGNWGSKVIAGGAPSATGKWKMNLMPQWTAGAEFNGNWGGNDFVVLKSTPHPQEAETFIRWMGTDPPTTVARTVAPFNNFPSSVSALQDPTFLNYHDPYFDQDINKVAVLAAKQANPAWEWAPFMGYVYATLGDEMLTFTAGNETMGQALKNLETKSKEYATSQGYTVK